MAEDDGFLSRWARRKAQVRSGDAPPEPVAPPAATVAAGVPAPVAPVAAGAISPTPAPETATEAEAAPAPAEAPPPPTLEEAQALTPEADFRRFVAPGVGSDVRNTALKKLWADPNFNVMDGLDIYIDDYGKPDPLPASMLRKLAHSAYLNLFDDEKPTPAEPAPPAAPRTAPDEDPALRLQPHDEPGPPGADEGAGEGPGHER
jgi:hypothetical protein